MFVDKVVFALTHGFGVIGISALIYFIISIVVECVSNYKEKKAQEKYERRTFIRNIDSACDDIYKIKIYCEMFEKYFKKGNKKR